MTRIHELISRGRTISFELFPPGTEEGERTLWEALGELEKLQPSFVSVTYGAGGSTRDRTHQLVMDLMTRTSMTPMAHLTAVNHTRDELAVILTRYRQAGVENVMLLRGDPPRGTEDPFWELERATDLVALAREIGEGTFSIGVAAHPEGHPLAPDLATDRDHLARKLALADFAVTQFFFRASDYLGMVDDLADRGCDTPVLAGIMPVTNVGQIVRFAQLSGADLPEELVERLRAVEDDPDEVRRVGVTVATELCQQLLDSGVPGLHFYTLNRSSATREIHANLGLSAR